MGQSEQKQRRSLWDVKFLGAHPVCWIVSISAVAVIAAAALN